MSWQPATDTLIPQADGTGSCHFWDTHGMIGFISSRWRVVLQTLQQRKGAECVSKWSYGSAIALLNSEVILRL